MAEQKSGQKQFDLEIGSQPQRLVPTGEVGINDPSRLRAQRKRRRARPETMEEWQEKQKKNEGQTG